MRDVVTTEGVLAHRDEASAGGLLAGSLGTWQRSDFINESFKAAFKVEPISNEDALVVNQLWQIRHVVVHGAGVVAALDTYRLRGAVPAGESLVLDKEYLEFAETELIRVANRGVQRVSEVAIKDFLRSRRAGVWSEDAKEFTDLFLLGQSVSPSQELPDVTELDYSRARDELAQ